MAETQRESVPRDDGSELETALAFLRFARHCVLKKTEGLDVEQLRRAVVPSGTSLLGLVQHLTDAETYWFGHHVAGDPAAADLDFSMSVPAERDCAAVLAAYRAAATASDEILAAVGDLDIPVSQRVDDEQLSVRWVVAHMTSETARHAGHADILREQIDGVTGR
ncbi:MAG: DinB family protein [Nocardioidaceae bacterium]